MDYTNTYAKFLKKFMQPKKRLRVVFDCSNGTTGIVIKSLSNLVISKLKIDIINSKPDGNFPAHGPNPMAKGSMDDLRKEVKKQKADLGVILDADGDRVFFVDNLGRSVSADAVAALMSGNFSGPVILDARAGYLARRLIRANGQKVVDSRVGHAFIKKLMFTKKVEFAAEMSGHYYFNFKGGAVWDSGILGAIYFINAVSKLKNGLADWLDQLPQYFHSGELNFKIRNKKVAINRIMRYYKKYAVKTSRLDGLRMEFPDWWFIVRPSNTEDLLRLILEAKTKKSFEKNIAKMKMLIK
ncbi:MAG: hypothetical protein Q8Q37_00455 [bacterium]|nr:hypothetical protein [bacterium]